MKLHTYWRSSAAYRVRIALAFKGLVHESAAHDIVRLEHRAQSYTDRNPQGLIPALEDGGAVIAQSLAIIEYLEETHPLPALLPRAPLARAQVRSFALAIACDIHPLDNSRVLAYLKGPLGADAAAVTTWYRHWIVTGFRALEEFARCHSADRCHVFGDRVTLADVCLVPQVYNARRFDCDLGPFPTLAAVSSSLERLPAFAAARPEVQPDAA